MKSIIRRLRWLQSARTTTSAIAYLVLSRFAILLFNIITGIIVARSLGPAGRGAAAAIDLWPMVMCGLLTLGIPIALRYQVRREIAQSAQLFSVALVISACLGLVAMVAGILFIPHWLSHYSPAIVRFGQAVMFFAPTVMLNNLLQAFWEAKGEFTQASRMMYTAPALTVTALIVLYKLGALTPYSVVLSYQIPCAYVTCMMLYKLRHSIVMPTAFIRRSTLLLHYGLRAYGLDVLNTLSSQIGQVLVVGLLSPTSFGFYAVAVSISRVLLTLSSSVNSVVFPKASGLDKDGAVLLVSRSARLVFATTALASAIVMPLLPALIALAYGKAYLPDVAIARILCVEAVLSATTITLAQSFMATGKPGLVTLLQAIGLCTTFPLMLVFIPRFGLAGAAYALLSSTSLRLVLVLVSYPMLLRRRIPGLLLTRQDFRDIFARVRKHNISVAATAR